MSVKDSLLALLIIAIWGFNFIIIAWGLETMPPLLMGGLRFLLVALLGLCFVPKPNIPWRWMALYALAIGFGQFALLFSAVAFGMPAGLASLVLQAQALFTVLFSFVLLKERIKQTQIFAMFIAIIGLILIGYSDQTSNMTLIGFLLTIAAASSWGLGNVVNRAINQRGYQANAGLVVWSAWIAMIPFFLTSYWVEGQAQIMDSLLNLTILSFVVLFYLAAIASIVGYSLWSYLLTHYPAGQIAPLTLMVPIVGMLCAVLLLDEQLTILQILGIIVVMLGLLINTFGDKLFSRFYQRSKVN